jgi:DNA-binding NtrC family response regulator
MQKHAITHLLNSSYFIVSGDKIEIRPVTEPGICAKHLPENRFPTLLELEQEYVQRVLVHVAGNKSRAAEVLGIDRVSLWRKLKRFGGRSFITDNPFEELAERA